MLTIGTSSVTWVYGRQVLPPVGFLCSNSCERLQIRSGVVAFFSMPPRYGKNQRRRYIPTGARWRRGTGAETYSVTL